MIFSTCLTTRSARITTRNTHLFICLSIRSIRLPTRSICMSRYYKYRRPRSTICRSFYNLILKHLRFKYGSEGSRIALFVKVTRNVTKVIRVSVMLLSQRWTDFTHCSGISIVASEQVNGGCLVNRASAIFATETQWLTLNIDDAVLSKPYQHNFTSFNESSCLSYLSFSISLTLLISDNLVQAPGASPIYLEMWFYSVWLIFFANVYVVNCSSPVNIYLFKVNYRKTRKRYEICSKLAVS